jgi:predicted kinase
MVFLLTGPSAAGKSTVARLLAQRFARGVHLEGDLFRRAIVSGRVEMTPALAPDAVEQLRLRHRLAAQTADEYARAGYDVVLEDVAAGDRAATPVTATFRSTTCTAASRSGPRIGTWLDTSDQTPEQTVDELLSLTR